MVLKEAFRYQNFLDDLINTARSYLSDRSFVTITTQKHMKKKANPSAEDETIAVESALKFKPNDLIDFICKALNEKEKLSAAICASKKTTEIDFDASVAMNKNRQNYIATLKRMVDITDTETITRGTGYKFNEAGDQVSYYYDLVNTTKINFNRNDVRGLIKKYQRECDDISNKLDVIQLTTVVDYNPIWDLTDTFEEIVAPEKE